jgi:hypothetical protein
MVVGIPLTGPTLELDLRLQDMEMDLQDFEAHLGFISDRFKSAMELVGWLFFGPFLAFAIAYERRRYRNSTSLERDSTSS